MKHTWIWIVAAGLVMVGWIGCGKKDFPVPPAAKPGVAMNSPTDGVEKYQAVL